MTPTPFSLYWVLRGERVVAGGPTIITFDDVSQFLQRHPEDFFPYDPCHDRYIKPVAAYHIAVADGAEDGCGEGTATVAAVAAAAAGGTASVATEGEENAETSGTAEDNTTAASLASARIMGVIGLCWVDLSSTPRTPANAVQGYLQIVSVHKPYRRTGVASRLLSSLFQERDPTLIVSGRVHCDAHGARIALCDAERDKILAQRKEANGTTAVARPISSWMLHTMSASSVATRAYLRHRLTKAKAKQQPQTVAAGERGTSSTANESGGHAQLAAAVPSLAEQVESGVTTAAAVTSLYTKLGFATRRTLYRYYGALADAVEMVKVVERSFKTARGE